MLNLTETKKIFMHLVPGLLMAFKYSILTGKERLSVDLLQSNPVKHQEACPSCSMEEVQLHQHTQSPAL